MAGAWLASGSLIAQSITAGLRGTVTDQSGAIVPKANVTATNPARNQQQTAVADDKGGYTLLNLQPGNYTIDVSAPGFKSFSRTGVMLEINQQAQVDAVLELGSNNQTVTVREDVSNIETTSSALSDVVNNREIRELPLNTRNVYSLVFLVPGAAGSIGNDYNSLSYTINGARSASFDTLVDGVPGGFPTVNGVAGIGVFPSVDAISEFRVLADNFPAEYGRSMGSIQNIIYKSGTNRFHGTVYEFLRNSALDANNFFSNKNGVDLPSFRRNQFGGEVDGPIIKNKTFFMFSIEELRQSSFDSQTATVPTLLQRQGDFSQTFAANGRQISIFDPFTTATNAAGVSSRTQFAGNRIPTGRIDPVAANVLKYYPLPNATGNPITNLNNYFASGSDTNNINQWDLRGDHNLTETQKLFARYSYRDFLSVPATFFPSDIAVAQGNITSQDFANSAVVGYNNTFNPTTVFDARLGFSRTLYLYKNPGLGFAPSSLGFPSEIDTAGGLAMFPTFNPSGYLELGSEGERRNAFMTYSLLASVTKIAGAHNIKAGFDGRIIRVNDNEANDPSGLFNFTQSFTQGPNPNVASATSGNSIASLLLGTGTGQVIQNFKNVATQSFYYGFYAQDDWHLTNKLTLNLGIRWDINTPRTERYDRMNYFDPSAASPLASTVPGFNDLRGGLVFVGSPTSNYGRSQFPTILNNVAPRIGFAYAADKNTVIRAGWGFVYGITPQQAQGTVGPFGYRVENDWIGSINGITPLNLLSNPFPQGVQSPTGSAAGLLTGVGGTIQSPLASELTPYTMQYNFNVQRTLPGSMLLQVAYVGNKGYQLSRGGESGFDLDQIDPRYLSLGSQLQTLVPNPFYGHVGAGVLAQPQVSYGQLLRTYPQYTSVIPLFSSGASSNYNALQVEFSKRFSNGLQFDMSYAYAKAMDQGTNHQNSFDISGDKAVASFDSTHRYVGSYIYELPYGHGQHFGSSVPGAVNLLLGNWQVQGITTLQSGTPLAISASNVNGLGTQTQYANATGQSVSRAGSGESKLDRYFNTAAFSQPAPFTLGNLSPYLSYLRGPGIANTDLSIFKQFLPREYLRIQFRAEFFNAFNRVQFGNPNTSVTSTNFGQITSQANSPRQIQFALKLLF